jgi:hypothetical protein
MVEEMLADVSYLLEMNLQAPSDMTLPVIKVKALVLQKMNGKVIGRVKVTVAAQVTLRLDTPTGQLMRESICGLLCEHHVVDGLLDSVVVLRMKCPLRTYLLQKEDGRERKKVSLKRRVCGRGQSLNILDT